MNSREVNSQFGEHMVDISIVLICNSVEVGIQNTLKSIAPCFRSGCEAIVVIDEGNSEIRGWSGDFPLKIVNMPQGTHLRKLIAAGLDAAKGKIHALLFPGDILHSKAWIAAIRIFDEFQEIHWICGQDIRKTEVGGWLLNEPGVTSAGKDRIIVFWRSELWKNSRSDYMNSVTGRNLAEIFSADSDLRKATVIFGAPCAAANSLPAEIPMEFYAMDCKMSASVIHFDLHTQKFSGSGKMVKHPPFFAGGRQISSKGMSRKAK